MLIRLPWLFTRRRLLVALLLDFSLFALLFTGWFQLRFGSWPSFSLPLTWLLEFWLLCSYVLGRYYDQEEQTSAVALKQLVRTQHRCLSGLSLDHGDRNVANRCTGLSAALPFSACPE